MFSDDPTVHSKAYVIMQLRHYSFKLIFGRRSYRIDLWSRTDSGIASILKISFRRPCRLPPCRRPWPELSPPDDVVVWPRRTDIN